LLDAVKRALGEDVDAVDDVVEEALRRTRSVPSNPKWTLLLTTGG
jgi:hypothetical protein